MQFEKTGNLNDLEFFLKDSDKHMSSCCTGWLSIINLLKLMLILSYEI